MSLGRIYCALFEKDLMAKGEPLLKELYVQDEYRIVEPDMIMPKPLQFFLRVPETHYCV